MKATLFQRGVGSRLAAAALFAVLAFAAVLLMEPSRAVQVATGPSDPAAATTVATLCIESIQPVGAWQVRLDGQTVEAQLADTTTWLAEMPVQPGSALVIDARPLDTLGAPRNSLRIRVAGTTPSRDHAVWCGREWSVAVRLNQLARAPRAIDPADLP